MTKQIPRHAKKVFNGILFDVYQWEQKLFDGSKTTFEGVVHTPSVQVIALTQDKKIVLLKEKQPFRGSFTSLIGGKVNSGEDYKTAAKRELLEETGMKCSQLEFFKIDKEAGHMIWNTQYYFAKGCKKVQEPQVDSGEKISVSLLDFDEFICEVAKPQFRNKGFSLMVLQMHYEKTLDEFKKKLLS